MFPMMLVLSLACTLAAPIHLLFALPYVPTCTMGLDTCARHSFLGAQILFTLSFSTHPAALISALPQHLSSPSL